MTSPQDGAPSRGSEDYQEAEARSANGSHQPDSGHQPDGMRNALPGAALAEAWQPRTLGRGAGRDEPATFSPAAGPAGVAGAADRAVTERLFGLIAIYTLAEGRVKEFDALAERLVSDVRAHEPDVLVYAVHSVPNAPMQRIFYEVYRDHTAYEEHKRYPYIQRFDAERAKFVLATNVIELGTQQAKVTPLPGLTQMFGSTQGE